MVWMPSISEDRPATVVPKITSSRPVSRPSRMAEGALKDRVEGQAVAASLTAQRLGECFGQFDNDLFRKSRSRRPGSAAASRVGSSKPSSALCQTAWAAWRSCAAIQPR